MLDRKGPSKDMSAEILMITQVTIPEQHLRKNMQHSVCHKTHVCGINVPLYPESDRDQKLSQKSIIGTWCVQYTVEIAFLFYYISTFLFWWENQDIIDDIVIINLFSIYVTEIPIGFVLLPKNASRQKSFKIAYLTLTVQHRAWCKYQN